MVLRPQLIHRNIWNLLDIAGTILQLQSTMEFHRQLLHQHHSQCHLHCGNDPIQLQITMEFHRQLIHQHHLQSHLHCGNDPAVTNHNGILSTANARNTGETPFTMRNRSEHDPRMIRPHTRPSRNRRTAEVDHRGSGTDFVWKNIGLRASAISQKRISCETSSKTPSATPPPAPLAMPFALRERSYTVANHNGIPSATHPPAPLAIPFTLRERSCSYKSQWNSVDRKCTKHRWNPIYNAEPIRTWSENDPTTHETVSQPSHRRGRSSRFGDGLCMEKHRASCICSLSKTHFVRDFLQNSIGNSSTSTTCNPIYSEGTILELQITMEFHRQLIHQHHLQSHLHCGNDPTVANHNGILSTANARNTGETPFTMRNRSEHDPRMIRPHTRPSRNRRTAEVDHRGSGTDFVWKNIGLRASAISQKRISCETSSKTPSATPPPAPLAIPFTVREQFLC